MEQFSFSGVVLLAEMWVKGMMVNTILGLIWVFYEYSFVEHTPVYSGLDLWLGVQGHIKEADRAAQILQHLLMPWLWSFFSKTKITLIAIKKQAPDMPWGFSLIIFFFFGLMKKEALAGTQGRCIIQHWWS